MLNVVTWNVNGIRSRVFNNFTSVKLPKNKCYFPEGNSPISNLINETNCDILCLQETRCDENNGSFAKIEGYHSYFNCSKLEGARAGNRYSGTAIYTKIKPHKIEYTVPDYPDEEGRMMIAYYDNFIIINVYSPNSGTNYDNKIIFQDAILNFINSLPKETKIIYCGDFNIAIDTHFDKSKVLPCPGIFPHELNYYTRLIELGFIDSKSTKDNIVYTWWDQRSKKIVNPDNNKETNLLRYHNKGWRLDYVFTKNIKYSDSNVLKHIGEEECPHGSDHAPVYCTIKL